MIKTIFWDFDGVISESLDVKTKAFYDLYLPYGKEIAEKVKQHHLDNGGMSRFEKFKYYHSNFLGYEIDENKIKELANQFSSLVLQGVIEAEEVKGVRTVLEKYYKTMNFFVVTGTPTKESELIINKKKMSQYFISICGSPKKKDVWCEELIKQYDLQPSEILFIGDANSDFNAATKNKLNFLLRWHKSNRVLFEKYNGFSIDDFTNFESILKQINNTL